MKIPILFLFALITAHAANQASSGFTTQNITVAGDSYDVTFGISWACDDYPRISAPGKIELLDSAGVEIAQLTASIYGGEPATNATGSSTVTITNSFVAISTPGGMVADGGLEGVWHLTGLAPGDYTLKLWRFTSWEGSLRATTIWTTTQFLGGADTGAPVVPPTPDPGPVYFTLNTGSTGGGSISGGGTFPAGASTGVVATPDPGYEFAGWSGDVGGTANPLVLAMNRDWNVQASFSQTALALATSALGGGAVTPGGSYPYGTWVTVSATADATHYFTGWAGDASGSSPSVAVFMDGSKWVQASFAAKGSQTISFAGPGDQAVGATPALSATTTSGLPVTFSVISGPATLSGHMLTVTGSGPVTVQAVQAGDAFTLPASPVSVTFNAVAAAARVRVQGAARTVLRDTRTTQAASYLLSNP